MPDINVNKLSETLNTKADIDLNNTGVFSTSEGGVSLTFSTPADAIGKEVTSADFFQSNLLNYTTNRILEIPQDIKLELNNGTLTLKAGSKVYVPNGFEADGTTPKFDVITLTEDKSRIGSITTTGTSMVCTYSTGEPFVYSYEGDGISQGYFSGPTAPTGHNYMTWYDTANNIIKTTAKGGSTWDSYRSFPIAIVSYSSNSSDFTSIDQVFNGFGYIGSTVFALPGVKVQIPNGRNADGTCKATLTTLTSVKTQTFTGAAQRGWYLQSNGASSGNSPVYSDTQPSQNYIRWFSQKDNQWYDTHSSPELNSKTYILPLALFNTDSTGKITSFEPYSVDSVANSNASNFSQAGRSYLSGLGMPSGRYIDLTLGASGSTYTAPANGWFHLQKLSGVANAIINMYNQMVGHSSFGITIASGNNASMNLNAYLPVKKGDSIYITYTATGETKYFTFNYAEGDNNV